MDIPIIDERKEGDIYGKIETKPRGDHYVTIFLLKQGVKVEKMYVTTSLNFFDAQDTHLQKISELEQEIKSLHTPSCFFFSFN